jgi:hypothetical protein
VNEMVVKMVVEVAVVVVFLFVVVIHFVTWE